MGVAVRESVINAIKHGNGDDERKHVYVEFTPLERLAPAASRSASATKAPGSTRATSRSARAGKPPENQRPRHLPHPQLHGRDAAAARPRGRHGSGDGEARAAGEPRIRSSPQPLTPPDPVFLATAVEIVLRAGEIQMARRESGFRDRQEGHDRSRHRGRSRVRADVPRGARRALSRSRHPGGGVEQRARTVRARHATAGSSIRSTARPTTRTACRCSARRSRSRSTDVPRSARSTTRRGGSSSPPSAARVLRQRRRARVVGDRDLLDALLVTGFPYDVHESARPAPARCSAHSSARPGR